MRIKTFRPLFCHSVCFVLIVGLFSGIACHSGEETVTVRLPAVAGKFYPADRTALDTMLRQMLDKAEKLNIDGHIAAAIAPHAGYVFSGQVAASMYKQLDPLAYETIVIIGPAHQYPLRGIAVVPGGFFETPLGRVEIDAALAEGLLAKGAPFQISEEAHRQEHCLEVQLPFIQKVFPPDVKVLPVLIGQGPQLETKLAEALFEVLSTKRALLIASTDMTHYPAATLAEEIDRTSLEFIKALDVKGLLEFDAKTMSKPRDNLLCTLCGLNAVVAVMEYAKKAEARTVEITAYAHSGNVPQGDSEKVVGYGAAVFSRKLPAPTVNGLFLPKPTPPAAVVTREGELLTAELGSSLVALARRTVDAVTAGRPAPTPTRTTPPWTDKRAVFVTLTIDGQLRGCIGHIFPVESLEQSVLSNAVSAALKDHRFPPLTADDAKRCRVEVSVLTVPRPVGSVDEIVIGTHGIVLEKGMNRAVFLPQVATDQGWDKATTLSYLSRKAGLPADGWQKGARFSVFETQIFHE